MRRLGIATVWVVLLALLGTGPTACKSNGPAKEPGRYYNEAKGFSIKFPADWEVKEDFLGAAVMGLSPQEGPADDFRENINVVVEEVGRGVTADQYFEVSLQNMQRLMTDFALHSQGAAMLGTHQARWIAWSHRMGMLKLDVLTYLLTSGTGKWYIITCTAPQGSLSSWREQFEEVAGTFRIQD